MISYWWVKRVINFVLKTSLNIILDHHKQKRFFAKHVLRARSHFVWLLWISRRSQKGVCKGTTTGVHRQAWNKIIEKRREYRKRCTPSPNSHQMLKPIKKKEKTFGHIFIKYTAHLLIYVLWNPGIEEYCNLGIPESWKPGVQESRNPVAVFWNPCTIPKLISFGYQIKWSKVNFYHRNLNAILKVNFYCGNL